jgi:serine phosphatase RsbU (regulator of sigma subunit)
MLRQETQTMAEELVAKNVQLERVLAEFHATMATIADHERVKRALEIVWQIQGQLLPTTFLQLPGLQFHAMAVLARSVEGDFHDAVCLGPQYLDLLLGDVAGQRFPAAMQMARLLGEFRASVSHRVDPTGVM